MARQGKLAAGVSCELSGQLSVHHHTDYGCKCMRGPSRGSLIALWSAARPMQVDDLVTRANGAIAAQNLKLEFVLDGDGTPVNCLKQVGRSPKCQGFFDFCP